MTALPQARNLTRLASRGLSLILFSTLALAQAPTFRSVANSVNTIRNAADCEDTSVVANTITCSTNVGFVGYNTGQAVDLHLLTSVTGAATININSLGAKAVTYNGTTVLVSGIMSAGGTYRLQYDGTRFVLQGSINTAAGGAFPAGSGTELQYRFNATTFGAIPNSSWVGLNLNIKDSSNTYNIFTLSTDLVNGDPDCNELFVIACDSSKPPIVATNTATDGLSADINAAWGGDTTALTGVGGNGGSAGVKGGSGGVASGGTTTSTGGNGGIASATGGDGAAAAVAGTGTNLGGNGGEAQLAGGSGGNASAGTSNTGGNGGITADVPGTGGSGATANGQDGYHVVDGSVLRGNRADKILAKWVTPSSGPIPAIHINGAVGLATILFANLGTGLEGDQFKCSNCQVTSSIDNTCATGGTGAAATYINGAWKCQQ
jgi:hypothetical protein